MTKLAFADHARHQQRQADRAEIRAEILAELIELGATLARAAAEVARAELAARLAVATAQPAPRPARNPRARHLRLVSPTQTDIPAPTGTDAETQAPEATRTEPPAPGDTDPAQAAAPAPRRPDPVRDFERLCAATTRAISFAEKTDGAGAQTAARRRAAADPALRRARLHAILTDMNIQPDELVEVMGEFLEDYCAELDAERSAIIADLDRSQAPAAAAQPTQAPPDTPPDSAPVAPPDSAPVAAAPRRSATPARLPYSGVRYSRRAELAAHTSHTPPDIPWWPTG